ncbi:MAG: group II truncated hemoglobin [Pontibacterium sp.]
MVILDEHGFGMGDNSFQAAGGTEGLNKLVNAFYDYMDTLPEAVSIRAQHPEDLTLSREKLAAFLSGWLGGPRAYAEQFGSINIPQAHRHLGVDESSRDAWLLCMQAAAKDQGYSPEFQTYLLKQLSIPAERIRQVCR